MNSEVSVLLKKKKIIIYGQISLTDSTDFISVSRKSKQNYETCPLNF
jgi:hypothetical protein